MVLSLVAFAAARPDYSKDDEPVAIIRSDFISPSEGGEYSFDVETADGISRSESGYGSEDNGAVASQGVVSFTHPDGTEFDLKFVANAAGYQPESDALPVAPAFPHPIPQFVIDQIEKAQEEDRNREPDPAQGDYVGYD